MMRYFSLVGFFVVVTCLRADDEIATTFTYIDPAATTVEVAGEFSNWKTLPMAKDASGSWTKSLRLKAGRYGYKLVVDAVWKFDPKNPARKIVNDIEHSAITVGNVSATPASAASETAATFAYTDAKAKAVFVAGQFNDWSATANPLKKDETGVWTVTIPLKAGKQTYKFVVDGDWRIDPANPDSVADGDGNMNSVRTVAP